MKHLETSLGPPVIAWFAQQSFEVYQEVGAWSGVADIVATSGPLLVVVELKMHLSFELLYQARRWRGVAHQVWVAVPHAKRSDGRMMAETCFAREGVGLLEVQGVGEHARVAPKERPSFNRRADVGHVRKMLREEHKTFAAAGTSAGGRWTEFKATVAAIKKKLAASPGATIADVVADVKHHYASDAGARSRIVSLIKSGVIAGVRTEKHGRSLRLYLEAS